MTLITLGSERVTYRVARDDGGLGEGVWGERRWDGGDDGGLGEGGVG